MEKPISEAEELPKAIVRRIVKDKLSHCSDDGDINLNKDSLRAFSESARIFIHYLSATANDICKESKRQTMNGDDVLKALEEIEFSEFLKPLKASLDEFRKKNAGKKAGASKEKEVKKKRKLEEASNKNESSEIKQDENEEKNKNEDEDEDEDGNSERKQDVEEEENGSDGDDD